jgi:hypothetical protein
MPLTLLEKSDLDDYVMRRACEEFRSGKPCVKRDENTKLDASSVAFSGGLVGEAGWAVISLSLGVCD